MACDLLDAVRELIPEVRERAAHTESQRRVSGQTLDALAATGLFAMFRPERHVGNERDPVDYFAAIRLLASACPSTGWAASLLGMTPWHIALMEPQAGVDVWGEGGGRGDALIAAAYAPVGRLVPARGGYRLRGEWRSAAAAEHCSWAVLGALLIGRTGEPVDYAAVLVPREDVTLTDGGSAVGLRGAGSKDVVVSDATVPAHRIYGSAQRMRIGRDLRAADAPALYRVPFASIHTTSVTAPLLGAAEGAYDYHLGRMRERNRLSHGGHAAENGSAHATVARGAAELDAATLTLERDLREQVRYAEGNQQITMELRLRARRDQVLASERAVAAIDLLFKAAGGHAVKTNSPIQRAWRDIHTGAAHLVNNTEQGLALYGRWAYGLGVDDSLILV